MRTLARAHPLNYELSMVLPYPEKREVPKSPNTRKNAVLSWEQQRYFRGSLNATMGDVEAKVR